MMLSRFLTKMLSLKRTRFLVAARRAALYMRVERLCFLFCQVGSVRKSVPNLHETHHLFADM
jgi:hypothetical protein